MAAIWPNLTRFRGRKNVRVRGERTFYFFVYVFGRNASGHCFKERADAYTCCMPSNRNALVRQVMGAVRELGAAAVVFQAALADSRGLSLVEARTLDMLARSGPLTAGELSTRSRLAPASVTGLVDRLVRKGVVRRGPHPRDGRRVLIETVTNGFDVLEPSPYRDFTLMLSDLCAEYTNEQLAAVASFATAAARRSAEAAARLNEHEARTAIPQN